MSDEAVYHFHVEAGAAGRTLKSILLTDAKMSRRLVRHLAQTNLVLRNGAPVFLTARVDEGDRIEIRLPAEETGVDPEPMSLDVRYEDAEVMVINKPAGILTHPTARERTGSLLAGVRAYLGGEVVPHCVHRLDRDTSGLVIFAKHAHAHQLLDRALRAGQVHRVYAALVVPCDVAPCEEGVRMFDVDMDGEPTTPQWHTIEMPIAQDPNKPSRRIIHPDGQRAVTHYQVVAVQAGVALLRIVLETGRTHQIRLHMATRSMPLLGEKDYHISAGFYPHSEPMKLDRHALHAIQLGWRHPVTGTAQVVAAEPPEDLQNIWEQIGGDPRVWHQMMHSKSALRHVAMLS